MGKNNELGKNGGLPAWKLATDIQRFKELTTSGVVVMGRKTFESFAKFNKSGIAKPLPNRTNVVITRDPNWQRDGVLIFTSTKDVLENFKDEDTIWIIGGGEIYKQFLEIAYELHLTHVDIDTEADIFFPEFKREDYNIEKEEFISANTENSHSSTYKIYTKKH